MCREHAEECVNEYSQKLGEHWTISDVREGQIDCNPRPTNYKGKTDVEVRNKRKAV